MVGAYGMRGLFLISLALLFPPASVQGFSFPRTPTLVWRLPRGLLAASVCVWTIQTQKAGLMAAGWSLRVVLAVCIFYDFFGLPTLRKILSLSKLREDPDFGASSVSSAVKI